MRLTQIALPFAAAFGLAGVLVAQPVPNPPGAADPARVTAGTYATDPHHSQILFAYDHFGLTRNMGLLSGATGTLKLDPKAPDKASVSVEVPINTLRTSIAKLDDELQGADWFDAAKFPTTRFVSTAVKANGNGAEISGNLTIHGITKAVTLDADFAAAGVNGFSKKETVSFNATTMIKRSDFGLGKAVPLVGDAVELRIVVAFEKQG